jgi:hypothetical protein
MPIEQSVAAWRTAEDHGRLTDLTLVQLPGADHLPTSGGRHETAAISPLYGATLTR